MVSLVSGDLHEVCDAIEYPDNSRTLVYSFRATTRTCCVLVLRVTCYRLTVLPYRRTAVCRSMCSDRSILVAGPQFFLYTSMQCALHVLANNNYYLSPPSYVTAAGSDRSCAACLFAHRQLSSIFWSKPHSAPPLVAVSVSLSVSLAAMVRASSRAHRAKPHRGGKPSPQQLKEQKKAVYKQRPASTNQHKAATEQRQHNKRTQHIEAETETRRRRPKSKAERIAWQSAHPRQPPTQHTPTRHSKRKAADSVETHSVEGQVGEEQKEEEEKEMTAEHEERPRKRRQKRLVNDTADALSLLDAIVESAERRESGKLTAEKEKEAAVQRRREAVQGRKERKKQQQRNVMEQARRLLNERKKSARGQVGQNKDKASMEGKKRTPARPTR